jgi:hypothetical protein
MKFVPKIIKAEERYWKANFIIFTLYEHITVKKIKK